MRQGRQAEAADCYGQAIAAAKAAGKEPDARFLYNKGVLLLQLGQVQSPGRLEPIFSGGSDRSSWNDPVDATPVARVVAREVTRGVFLFCFFCVKPLTRVKQHTGHKTPLANLVEEALAPRLGEAEGAVDRAGVLGRLLGQDAEEVPLRQTLGVVRLVLRRLGRRRLLLGGDLLPERCGGRGVGSGWGRGRWVLEEGRGAEPRVSGRWGWWGVGGEGGDAGVRSGSLEGQ